MEFLNELQTISLRLNFGKDPSRIRSNETNAFAESQDSKWMEFVTSVLVCGVWFLLRLWYFLLVCGSLGGFGVSSLLYIKVRADYPRPRLFHFIEIFQSISFSNALMHNGESKYFFENIYFHYIFFIQFVYTDTIQITAPHVSISSPFIHPSFHKLIVIHKKCKTEKKKDNGKKKGSKLPH